MDEQHTHPKPCLKKGGKKASSLSPKWYNKVCLISFIYAAHMQRLRHTRAAKNESGFLLPAHKGSLNHLLGNAVMTGLVSLKRAATYNSHLLICNQSDDAAQAKKKVIWLSSLQMLHARSLQSPFDDPQRVAIKS